MKKIFFMLIIAISAMVTVNAQSSRKQVTNRPVNVIKQLNFIIDTYGQKNNQSYSVKRNPNTNLIESSEKIAHFSFNTSNNDQQLSIIRDAFTKDEPVSYQFKHITPGIYDLFTLEALSENGKNSTTHLIRTEDAEEMWFMCCKNPENPMLRDAFAITWKVLPGDGVIDGYVYMITSLRPDLFTKNMESSDNMFRIEGRMGDDINDSLYIFYMADTYEELNKLTMRTHSYEELKRLAKTDPEFIGKIAYMPIRNRHFELNVNIGKRKVGRQRTVMPDGSLCKLWVNLDMVPGETYHLTVHNGYFEEDRDYESRVGRNSGMSMIAGHDNDDVELTGGYPDSNEDSGTVALGAAGEDSGYAPGETSTYDDPFKDLTPAQRANIEIKGMKLESCSNLIESLYKTVSKDIQATYSLGGEIEKKKSIKQSFNQIIKQNETFDQQIEDLIKTVTNYNIPQKKIVGLHKVVIEYFTKQNKGLNELVSKYGHLSQAGAKCQKQVTKLTEKYIDKMTKSLE